MADNKIRVVFVNLHGNEFLVKTLNKIIFKQSVAVKHRYLLDYLLDRDDIEVCTYINERGLSLSYTTRNRQLQSFRFMEHRIAMKKNGIPLSKVTVLKSETDLRPTDIIVVYAYYGQTQLYWKNIPEGVRVICQIHFGTKNADLERRFAPHAMYNESNLQKYSGMWRRDLPWFSGKFLTMPFVYEPRFQSKKPFTERKCKAVSVGTITYMPNIADYYGDPCAQPARRNCRVLAKECPDVIDSFNSDYLEDQHDVKRKPTSNPVIRVWRRLHDKFTVGHQKQYYSFNMVDKFNDYRIAVVGEEIMGIPGIGFVEAMACGCAYIGQTTGYYEEYGMREGEHYIGYDGTKEGLRATIEYWQRPENQDALERIAATGCRFVRENFCGPKVAERLLESLIALAEQK